MRDLKSIGIMLGGIGAVTVLSILSQYAKSRSLAETMSRRAGLMGRALKAFEKSVSDYERTRGELKPHEDVFTGSEAERSKIWQELSAKGLSYDECKVRTNQRMADFYRRRETEFNKFGEASRREMDKAAEERFRKAEDRVSSAAKDISEVLRSATPEERKEMYQTYESLGKLPGNPPDRFTPWTLVRVYRGE